MVLDKHQCTPHRCWALPCQWGVSKARKRLARAALCELFHICCVIQLIFMAWLTGLYRRLHFCLCTRTEMCMSPYWCFDFKPIDLNPCFKILNASSIMLRMIEEGVSVACSYLWILWKEQGIQVPTLWCNITLSSKWKRRAAVLPQQLWHLICVYLLIRYSLTKGESVTVDANTVLIHMGQCLGARERSGTGPRGDWNI